METKFYEHLTALSFYMKNLITLLAVSFALMNSSTIRADVTFTELGGFLGKGQDSIATGVSSDGSIVVGWSHGVVGADEAFIWENGTMKRFSDLPNGAGTLYASAISPDGLTIVGRSDTDEAFRWTKGTMTKLGDVPGAPHFSHATGVSSDGSVVVGMADEAFRWENGEMVALGSLPGGGDFSLAHGVSSDGSIVVGESNSSNGREAFIWQNNSMTGLGDLEGGGYSVAYAVSSDGSVVVGQGTSSNGLEAFRWKHGTMLGLGDLEGGAFSSTARGVSADGSIIVGNSSSSNESEAFFWTEDLGMVSLFDYLELNGGGDFSGWSEHEATGISADGSAIVGYGKNPLGVYEGFLVSGLSLTAVPEPSTIAILSVFGICILLIGRRGRKVPTT